jgi:hypothetical protein
MGVPQACIRQKADFSVGDAWLPIYTGPDQEAGKAAAKFMAEFWFPQCSTIGGNFDWWKMLETASISMDVPGDIFWVMVKGEDGFPRLQMVPSHRCYSQYDQAPINGGQFNGYRVNDGVITYSSGRAAGYRFNVGKDGKEDFRDLPASDVIHLFDPIFPDQKRGLPAFTHALESLKMSLFSTEDERIRQQIISRLHLTIFNADGTPDLDDPINDIPANNGTSQDLSTKAFPGGVYYQANGDKIEQMKHENPGPIWDSFQDRIIRDAIMPVWSYSIWKSTGQGTAERGEVLKCRKFIEKRQRDLFIGARRGYIWAYVTLMVSGRAPKVSNPFAWDFSRPPRLTVDDGRESKMELEELRTGSRNMDEILGARGLTEEEFTDKRARSVWMRKHKARSVAKELNAKYGEDIEIEDREMFMLTPNEVAETEPEEPQTPSKNEPNSD